MKKYAVLAGIVAVIVVAYLGLTTVAPVSAPVAVAAGPTYSAMIYVAGMGGHFAAADVTVDPSNAAEPVKIKNLDRVVIGDKQYATHDARIDTNDSNVMFWSTYVLDANGKIHVGKTDLKTGKVIKDLAVDPDARAVGKGPKYCASGQSKEYFMPVFMGVEGYVDVFDKKDLAHKHRVFVSDIGYAKGSYKFVHGINSPDMKSFLLTMNVVKDGNATGEIDFVLVDMASLEKGKFKVLAKNTLKGDPKNSITFRMYFTPDGKYITQSVADRLWVLDAKKLTLVDEKMMPEGSQLHDAMPTPDSKYALLTIRSVTEGCDTDGKAIVKDGKPVDITDGTVMVYDAANKKVLDKQISVCLGCHKGMGLGDKNAVLCGIDANYK
ncbi:MAG: hypothetical protein OEW15_11350 [Nitrospirota bacterium]|nr:hypothetical protein [Nitrospirota bacterium]